MIGFKHKCLLGLCLASLLAGCWAPAANESQMAQSPGAPSASRDNTLDAGPVLMAHTQALAIIDQAMVGQNHGVPRVEDSCIDNHSGLVSTWLTAIGRRTDGAWMRLALRMSEQDEAYVPQAIELIGRIKIHAADPALDDVFDYHIARLWRWRSKRLNGDEAKAALESAVEAYGRVISNRLSPYYHWARAEKIEAQLALGRNIADEIDEFIDAYPDYPSLFSLKYEQARLWYENGTQDRAVASMQDLAFWYPWHEISRRANQWLTDRQLSDRERSFDEVFGRVESLRKMRFWDEADEAAQKAMQAYPESYQLKVQYARIAYERSDHQEGARRFESILEQLGGETKDKLKPSGVIAYIYRAYAYMGACPKALEYHALNASKLAKANRLAAVRDFALSCGDLETAYENDKQLALPTDVQGYYDHAFLAYLNHDYETSRLYFAAAVKEMSGSYKRRAQYFLAQSTLKLAQQNAFKKSLCNDIGKMCESSDAKPAAAQSNASKSSKKSKSKKKKSTVPNIKLTAPTIDGAKKQFQSMIADNSSDYYSILAYSRLEELDENRDSQHVETPVIQTLSQTDSDNKELVRNLDSEYTFNEKANLADFDNNIEKYKDILPDLKRVQFFHDAELYRERNALFRRIAIEVMGITRMGKRPTIKNLWTAKLSIDGHLVDNRKKDLGVWGTQIDQYLFNLPPVKDKKSRESILAHQTSIFDAGTDLRDFVKKTLTGFHDYYLSRRYTPAPKSTCGAKHNNEACSVLYPHAYSRAVIEASQNNRIQPSIIWALMNIESAFNPDSISHADAYGLLQIIPMTGYKIAKALNVDDFGPYELIKPEKSIAMGTWYFGQILLKFQGYTTLSMAGYNGGPHQVARWLTAYASKVEHDAFIELIPYDEARNYVKKGMARLLIFERIDHGDPGYFFEIPNTLPDNFEQMPNY